MLKLTGQSAIRLFAQQPDGSNQAFAVPSLASLDCMSSVQGRALWRLPASTNSWLAGEDGRKIWDNGQKAGCALPSNWVESVPGGAALYQVSGDGANSPYVRRRYVDQRAEYYWAEGHPVPHTMSAEALNGIAQGPDLAIPAGAFFRDANRGTIYQLGGDGAAHPLPNMDTLSCLGNPRYIDIPAAVLDGIRVGSYAQCAREGQLVRDTQTGALWLIRNGQKDYVLNMAIADELMKRIPSTQGRWTDVPHATLETYKPGPNAYVDYGRPALLHYPNDPNVYLVDGDHKWHVMNTCWNPNNLATLTVWTADPGEFDGQPDWGRRYLSDWDCNQIANRWPMPRVAGW
jgi:hypothetical protein